MYQTEFISEDTHYHEIGMEHLFHVFSSNDGNILHGVGIFRVQPGVVEVGLVENTRELGKLQ
jgi:hypothetical protein